MAIITDPDWIDPEETTFDVEKPIRSEQGVMLAGNVIAAFQGKPGAPGLNFKAIEQLAAGDAVRVSYDDEAGVISGAGVWPDADGVLLVQRGTVRVSFEARGHSSAEFEVIRIRDGSETVVHTVDPTGSYALYEVDVAVMPGDAIKIVGTVDSLFDLFRRNTRLKTAGQNIWRVTASSAKALDGNDYT